MRSYQDVILFHKDSKYYGYITYGEYLQDKDLYEAYLSENNLKAEVLAFNPHEQDLSPEGMQTRKAVEYLLFKVDADLDDGARESIYKIVLNDYARLMQLISDVSNKAAAIYQRAYGKTNCNIIDLNKFKRILDNNTASILTELEGD